ncbi:MAG: hypothetical protein ACP5UO_03845 [Thermoplasmata archaeon]
MRIIEIILLPLLLFSGYEDVKKRMINTLPYLALDLAILGIFLYYNPILSLFAIPLILEYFLKRYSYVTYFLLIVPVSVSPSILTVSIAYSISLIKVFSLLVRNFGTGDLKVLQAIAISFPLYLNLPALDSLFPPVLAVMLIASISGAIAGTINSKRRTFGEVDQTRYWMVRGKRRYKIPFVAFISGGYVVLLILSLLRVA